MERFFEEFSAGTGKEKWMEEVLKDLKGRTYDKIWWKTYEGFDLEPYYKASEIEGIVIPEDNPGEFPYLRSAKPLEKENGWTLCQEISQRDPVEAKKAAEEAVKGGAECIDLKLSCELTSGKTECCTRTSCRPEYKRGVVINSEGELKGIVEAAGNSVNIEAGTASKEIFGMIESDLNGLKGSIDNDPLKELAWNGEFAKGEDKRFEEAKHIFDKCSKYPDFKGMAVSGVHFHDAGATIVQKIAYMLSTAVFYKERIAPEMSFGDFNRNIRLSYGVGQYYLLEIAGIRALRMLWSNIASAYGEKNSAPDIHAVTGLFNKTVFDPYVNMLRTTTEAMSAVLGGCGSLTVLPYNVCIGEADTFAMRIARNTQLILRDEAHFDRFVDPAKGSYFIEKATDLIAKEAWNLFKRLESEGGIYEALKKGEIQKDLTELKKKRLSNFSMRRDNLVGTNFVPNYSEKSVCGEPKSDIVQKLDLFGSELYKTGGVKIEKVKQYRLAEEFEKLRKATEKYSEVSGKKVTAFLATIGNLTMRKARASFSMGYLAAGGFDIIDNNGFKDSDEAAAEALKSGAEIIVICSSDDEYPVVAPEIAAKIKASDPGKVIVLAGYPKDIVDDLKKAGVDEFIHLKSDSLETIRNIQTKLRITE